MVTDHKFRLPDDPQLCACPDHVRPLPRQSRCAKRLAGLHRHKVRDSAARVEAYRFREVEKLHHIEAPLSAFNHGDERLVSAKLVGNISLSQSSPLPLFYDECPQRLVPRRAQRFRH